MFRAYSVLHEDDETDTWKFVISDLHQQGAIHGKKCMYEKALLARIRERLQLQGSQTWKRTLIQLECSQSVSPREFCMKDLTKDGIRKT